jgi:hypothetical protein
MHHFPSACSAICIDHSQSWFQEFIALRGTSVLAQTLQNLSRSGSSRYISPHYSIYNSNDKVADLTRIKTLNMKSPSA